MISKKFLGIFGLVVLAVVLLPLISAPCSCFPAPSCGVNPSGDNCGQCYSPSLTSCMAGSPTCFTGCSCVVDNTELCSLACTMPDQCPSSPALNVYTDYIQGTYNSYCLGGICQDSCPVAATGVCDVSKVCNNVWEYCGGTQLTCVNVSSLKYSAPYQRWVSTIPGEIDAVDCSDGIDNDCDDLYDCNDPGCSAFCSLPDPIPDPTSPKLRFRNVTNNIAVIGSNGVMDIRGSLTTGQSSITSVTNDFLIKDSFGNIVAKLDTNGNLVLKGANSTRTQPQLNAYIGPATKEFIVKNSAGDAIAVFDSNGNLYVLNGIRTLQANPQ